MKVVNAMKEDGKFSIGYVSIKAKFMRQLKKLSNPLQVRHATKLFHPEIESLVFKKPQADKRHVFSI